MKFGDVIQFTINGDELDMYLPEYGTVVPKHVGVKCM